MRVEDEVRPRFGDQPCETLRADEHVAVLGRAGAGVRIGERKAVDPVLARKCQEPVAVGVRTQADELEGLRSARDHVQRLASHRARGAEDEEPLHSLRG